MADKKISQLTNLAPALNTDQLPINRGGVSGKLTVSEILTPEATLRANADGDLSTLTTTNQSDLVSAINEVNGELPNKIPTSYLDTDTSLTANSDSKIATQKATKAYVLANVTPAATESVAGKAEIATQTETNTGTDDTRFITPLKLKTNLTSLGYLGGAGTANYLPKYTASNTLGNSAIQQSATGNRILLNGVTDDTTTALQVSGSIRQTTVTSKLTAFDANGKLVDGGSGALYRHSMWNSTSTLGNSSILEDGSGGIGISYAPNSAVTKLGILSSVERTLAIYNTATSLDNKAVRVLTNPNSTDYADPVSITNFSCGILSETRGTSNSYNIGIIGLANKAGTPSNIGGVFEALNSSTNNYAIQLYDGTQGTGKFLKSVTTDGKANWATITTADISSTGFSGTPGSLARWATSSTLGTSTINDNGSQIGIGNAPLTNSKLFLATTNTIYSLNSSNSSTSGITYGVYSTSSGAKALQNIGVGGYATNSTTENTGVLGSAVSITAGKNVGGYFVAANSSSANYAVQLKDGTEAAGKVLQCMDSNGNANWISHYIINTISANTAFTNEPININFDLGNYVIIDYSSSIAVATSTNAVTFSNMKQGRTYKIKVKQGTSSAGETYTPTFAGMKWPGGTAFTPTVGTGKIDFIEVYYDGVAYYGDFIKNYA